MSRQTGLPKGLSVKKVENGWEVIHTASGNGLMPFAYPEKQLAVDFAQRAGQVADWTKPFSELQSHSDELATAIRGGVKPGMFEPVIGMPTSFPKSELPIVSTTDASEAGKELSEYGHQKTRYSVTGRKGKSKRHPKSVTGLGGTR